MRRDTIGVHMVRFTVLVALATLSATVYAQSPTNGSSWLSPAIRKAFEHAYPGATISSTSQQSEGSRTLVRVESLDKGRRRVLLYDAGGAIVEVAEQVEEKDLPQPVAAAMRSHPRAIYGSGMKVSRGGRVEYHLTLRGTRKTSMIAQPDGTVVSFK